MNVTAPWLASYTLERTIDGFAGAALFSAGDGLRKVVRQFALPLHIALPFLEALGETRVTVGEYQPRFTHTNDFPDLEIHLETPSGGVTFSSSSQGRYHTPWAVSHAGECYVVLSARPAKALNALQPALRRDVLEGLIAELERE